MALLTGALGPRVRAEAPLGPRCTYGVGGAARVLVTIEDQADLDRLAGVIGPRQVPTLVLGRGSNLLVADRGFDGVAVVLGRRFGEIEFSADGLTAGAGAALPVLARRSAAAGLRGFEWAVGVPGSLGGAVMMNAGGHGSDLAACLVEVEVADLHRAGSVRWLAARELDLRYRHSNVGSAEIVLRARMRLEPGDAAQARALVDDIVAWRRENQPGGSNAGSVFTNPPGDSAGRLIEAAGAKGLRHRSAEVSTKHANFIQADPGGSAQDVFELMGRVQQLVAAHGGPWLQPETRLVGFPSAPPAPAPEGHETPHRPPSDPATGVDPAPSESP
ncbi:MAG: UDP-N-acetylmuramate dehydrogenase [Acidimicrobiales bacterium]